MNTKIEKKKISSLDILKRTLHQLSAERKKDLKYTIILSIFVSLSESISIAMLIPFISFFINPDNYLFNSFFNSFFNFLNITEKNHILLFVSLSFILIVILSGFIKIKYTKFSNNLVGTITSDFRKKIFKFFIDQDFSYHFKYGTNEIMSNLAQKTEAFYGLFFSVINILNSLLITIAIFIILIFNEPFYTPVILITIFLFFYSIFKIKSSSVIKKGQNISSNQNFLVDIFQNSVGYFPEIIIYNLKSFFLVTLSKASDTVSRSDAEIRTISLTPRIYLETFIIVFVVLLINFSGLSERSLDANISYLAILAFGAHKCLPSVNNIYICYQ